MNKPIIGIVGRPNKTKNDDNIICCFEKLRKTIIKKGGIPLLILPNQPVIYETKRYNDLNRLTIEEKNDLNTIINLCDGIVLPGGSKWYEYDEYIFEYSLEKDIPFLGLCLGMQIMGKCDNDMHNITYRTILPNENENHNKSINTYVHKINIKKDSILYSILNKESISVNSFHSYHLNEVHDFIVSATSNDNLIEAIEYPNKRFILGIQFHPESIDDETSNKIFNIFINKTIEYKEIK